MVSQSALAKIAFKRREVIRRYPAMAERGQLVDLGENQPPRWELCPGWQLPAPV